MALSFIGKPISLISHSDVRYRGILAGIDPAASTIQLSNVYSMGTESRRPPTEFIPPVQEPYQYIIFRASEVKDLAVDEPAPRRSVHDDPAVLGASAPAANPAFSPYPAPATAAPPVQQQAPPPPQPAQPPPTQGDAIAPARPQVQARRSNPVHTAAASLETVERAIGDLRVSHNNHPNAANGRVGRRGGRGGGRDNVQIKVPATDFDFESSNAKFDKAALTPRSTSAAEQENGDEEAGDAAQADADKEKEKEKETAYNPQKSFFDSLSSSSHGAPALGAGAPNGGGHAGNGRGRRGGRGMGRNRREEEREKNVSTFGEPGGVGLMGPGAYVGGWGGYGRRGGRPRRGGPQGGGGGPTPQAPVQARV